MKKWENAMLIENRLNLKPLSLQMLKNLVEYLQKNPGLYPFLHFAVCLIGNIVCSIPIWYRWKLPDNLLIKHSIRDNRIVDYMIYIIVLSIPIFLNLIFDFFSILISKKRPKNITFRIKELLARSMFLYGVVFIAIITIIFLDDLDMLATVYFCYNSVQNMTIFVACILPVSNPNDRIWDLQKTFFITSTCSISQCLILYGAFFENYLLSSAGNILYIVSFSFAAFLLFLSLVRMILKWRENLTINDPQIFVFNLQDYFIVSYGISCVLLEVGIIIVSTVRVESIPC